MRVFINELPNVFKTAHYFWYLRIYNGQEIVLISKRKTLNAWDIRLSHTLIKKKTKFSSYSISGNSDGIRCKVIYEEGLPDILYEEIRKYFTKYEEAVSHIWLYTWSLWISLFRRKILFSFFYHCRLFLVLLGDFCAFLFISAFAYVQNIITNVRVQQCKTVKVQHCIALADAH